MKIEVNIRKKYFISLMAVVLLLIGAIAVYAYNTQGVYSAGATRTMTTAGEGFKTAAQASQSGHTADETNVKIGNEVMTLQEAINSGGLGGGFTVTGGGVIESQYNPNDLGDDWDIIFFNGQITNTNDASAAGGFIYKYSSDGGTTEKVAMRMFSATDNHKEEINLDEISYCTEGSLSSYSVESICANYVKTTTGNNLQIIVGNSVRLEFLKAKTNGVLSGSDSNLGLEQTARNCKWSTQFRQEGGQGTSASAAGCPLGSYVAGVDYRAETGSADGVMRIQCCSLTPNGDPTPIYIPLNQVV